MIEIEITYGIAGFSMGSIRFGDEPTRPHRLPDAAFMARLKNITKHKNYVMADLLGQQLEWRLEPNEIVWPYQLKISGTVDGVKRFIKSVEISLFFRGPGPQRPLPGVRGEK